MIRVYLVRHGIARDGSPDAYRPLTGEGRARFRKVAKTFAKLGETVDAIYTSPLVRAVQTAEILAAALKLEDVGVVEQLISEVPARTALEAVSHLAEDGQGLALVGHEPQMSALARALTNTTEGLDVRKGSILRIDVDALPPTSGQARYWIRPKTLEVIEGLPRDRG